MTDAAHFGETKPSGLSAPLTSPPVIAGLDPAIHRFERIAFSMDARVKPAHDGSRTATQAAPHFAKRSQQARAAGAGFCEDAEPLHEPFQGQVAPVSCFCPVMSCYPTAAGVTKWARGCSHFLFSSRELRGSTDAGLYPRFLFSSVIYRERAFTDKTSSRATLELLLQKSSLKPCGPTP